jgi:hypothetical protein
MVLLMEKSMNKKAISEANKRNNNSNKDNRMPTQRLRMELKQNPVKVKKMMAALIDKAISGDMAAIREVFDRVDGKVAQHNNISADMNHNDNYTIKVITDINKAEEVLPNEMGIEFIDAPKQD